MGNTRTIATDATGYDIETIQDDREVKIKKIETPEKENKIM